MDTKAITGLHVYQETVTVHNDKGERIEMPRKGFDALVKWYVNPSRTCDSCFFTTKDIERPKE